jgi:protein associated with RNAse G/E
LFKKRKYGNKKVEVEGIKFDSKLELYCYELLTESGLVFDFQKQITLIDKFRYNGEAVRAVTIIVDFVVYTDDKIIYIDTKGFATDTSKLKYKMLKHYLKDDTNTSVVWLHNKKEVAEYINSLTK